MDFEDDNIDELDEVDENAVFDEVESSEPVKPFLALCEKCNEPLYKKHDIHRIETNKGSRIYCAKCYNKMIAQAKEAKAKKIAEVEKLERIAARDRSKQAKKTLIHSIIWPVLLSLIWFIVAFSDKNDKTLMITGVILGIISFTWFACLILKENMVTDWYSGLWDGLVSDHAGMNIILWLLGWFAIVFAIMLLYTALSFLLAPFVYPFALAKKIRATKEYKKEN